MAQSESLQQLVEGTRDKNRPACEGWCGEKTHDAKGEPIWTLVDRTSSVGYAIACIEALTGQRFTPSISLSPPPSPPSGSEGPSILTCGFKQREAPAGASIRPPSARHVAQYAARHDRHVAQYAARHDQSQALSQTGLRISQGGRTRVCRGDSSAGHPKCAPPQQQMQLSSARSAANIGNAATRLGKGGLQYCTSA